jgi:hypothetical protein
MKHVNYFSKTSTEIATTGMYKYTKIFVDAQTPILDVLEYTAFKGTGYVQVVVHNASHKAYKGMGKYFDTLDTAIANYKKREIKALLISLKD